MPYRYPDAKALADAISAYFTFIEGEFHLEEVPARTGDKQAAETKELKIWDRPPEPPTLSGLALHLGFESRQALEDHAGKGRYAPHLKRARLRIEAEYERRLHIQSCAGAVFALKSMGWNERAAPADETVRTIEVTVTKSGPAPAHAEQEVIL